MLRLDGCFLVSTITYPVKTVIYIINVKHGVYKDVCHESLSICEQDLSEVVDRLS